MVHPYHLLPCWGIRPSVERWNKDLTHKFVVSSYRSHVNVSSRCVSRRPSGWSASGQDEVVGRTSGRTRGSWALEFEEHGEEDVTVSRAPVGVGSGIVRVGMLTVWWLVRLSLACLLVWFVLAHCCPVHV